MKKRFGPVVQTYNRRGRKPPPAFQIFQNALKILGLKIDFSLGLVLAGLTKRTTGVAIIRNVQKDVGKQVLHFLFQIIPRKTKVSPGP